jgi:hypothetical protein
MYSWPRLASIAGELPQTAPPVYPDGTIIVFQRSTPVFASSAAMLPRKLQHG